MLRKNRLKKILSEMGYKVNDRQQPINDEKLQQLGLSSVRMRDLMEHRGPREMTITELDALSNWLGMERDELLVPENSTEKEDVFKVTFAVNIIKKKTNSEQLRIMV